MEGLNFEWKVKPSNEMQTKLKYARSWIGEPSSTAAFREVVNHRVDSHIRVINLKALTAALYRELYTSFYKPGVFYFSSFAMGLVGLAMYIENLDRPSVNVLQCLVVVSYQTLQLLYDEGSSTLKVTSVVKMSLWHFCVCPKNIQSWRNENGSS